MLLSKGYTITSWPPSEKEDQSVKHTGVMFRCRARDFATGLAARLGFVCSANVCRRHCYELRERAGLWTSGGFNTLVRTGQTAATSAAKIRAFGMNSKHRRGALAFSRHWLEKWLGLGAGGHISANSPIH